MGHRLRRRWRRHRSDRLGYLARAPQLRRCGYRHVLTRRLHRERLRLRWRGSGGRHPQPGRRRLRLRRKDRRRHGILGGLHRRPGTGDRRDRLSLRTRCERPRNTHGSDRRWRPGSRRRDRRIGTARRGFRCRPQGADRRLQGLLDRRHGCRRLYPQRPRRRDRRSRRRRRGRHQLCGDVGRGESRHGRPRLHVRQRVGHLGVGSGRQRGAGRCLDQQPRCDPVGHHRGGGVGRP